MLMKTAFFFVCEAQRYTLLDTYNARYIHIHMLTGQWVVADVQYYRSPLNIFVFVSVGILGRLTMISNA